MQREKLAPQALKVALSNESKEEDVTRAKSLGADAYLIKAEAVPSETVARILLITRAN